MSTRNLPPPIEITAYFTSSGSSGASDMSISVGTVYKLYDASGNAISFDSTKTYETINIYNRAGQRPVLGEKFGSYQSSNGQLAGQSTQYFNVFRMTIRVS